MTRQTWCFHHYLYFKNKNKNKKIKFFVMTRTLCRWAVVTKAPYFPVKNVRQVQTTHFARKVLGCTSLGFALASCEGLCENKLLKNSTLTHEQCIKQACLVNVNSASTLLTTTSAALMDICREYKESLNRILSLLHELKTVEGENPGLWDLIVEARSRVNNAKSAVTELNCYMESVEKVVTSTTEAAFLAGAEYICSALCDRLTSAQREINIQIAELKKLEEEYVKMQQEIASLKSNDGKKTKAKDVIKIDEDKFLLKQ